MTRIEEIISNALAGIDETEVAILSRELLKTREELALAQQEKGEAEGRAALADRRALGMNPHVFAAMVNSVRDLARQYGSMEQFRCRVADLLGKYIPVEHNSEGVPKWNEASAVGIPDFSDAEAAGLACENGYDDDDYKARDLVKASWAYARFNSRAIPADRVLGDGAVKILESERRELALLRQHFQLFEKEHSENLDEADRAFNARQEVDELLRLHLRANQGGA